MSNIASTITTQGNLNKDIVKKWLGVMEVLKAQAKESIEIDPAACEEYAYDLEGLLTRYVGIPADLVYPTMLLNGYNCSYSYNGVQSKFLTLNNTIATTYAAMFKRVIGTPGVVRNQ